MEYGKDVDNKDITEHDIVLNDGLTIRINKIRTDNFSNIYTSISNLHLPVTALEIRKVQNVVKQIYAGGDIKVSITEDIDNLKNGDKVLAIGSKKTISYHYETAPELLFNYFKIIEESNSQILNLIDKYRIQSTQYFPIHGFETINPDIKSLARLKKQQLDNVRNGMDRINNASKKQHTSIDDIISDETIRPSYKSNSIIWNTYNDNIPLDIIETYLKENASVTDTDYRKLLSVYDLKKYAL